MADAVLEAIKAQFSGEVPFEIRRGLQAHQLGAIAVGSRHGPVGYLGDAGFLDHSFAQCEMDRTRRCQCPGTTFLGIDPGRDPAVIRVSSIRACCQTMDAEDLLCPACREWCDQ